MPPQQWFAPWQHCVVYSGAGEVGTIYTAVQIKPTAIVAQTTQGEDMNICLGFDSRVSHIMPQCLPQYIVEFMGGPKYQFIFGYGH